MLGMGDWLQVCERVCWQLTRPCSDLHVVPFSGQTCTILEGVRFVTKGLLRCDQNIIVARYLFATVSLRGSLPPAVLDNKPATMPRAAALITVTLERSV